jgi:hypothetical protein
MALPARADRPFTEVDLSRLAREVARQLKPLELILQQLQISSDQWERIQHNPIFSTRLSEEAAVWSASTRQTIRERVATKAAAMVEELLGEAVGMVQDEDIPGAARVAALQFIAKMGNLGEGAQLKDDGSGRVTINITLGGQKLTYDKEGCDPRGTDACVINGEAEEVDDG